MKTFQLEDKSDADMNFTVLIKVEPKSLEICELPNEEQDQDFIYKRTPSNRARLNGVSKP